MKKYIDNFVEIGINENLYIDEIKEIDYGHYVNLECKNIDNDRGLSIGCGKNFEHPFISLIELDNIEKNQFWVVYSISEENTKSIMINLFYDDLDIKTGKLLSGKTIEFDSFKEMINYLFDEKELQLNEIINIIMEENINDVWFFTDGEKNKFKDILNDIILKIK